jgi:hypothetical protein
MHWDTDNFVKDPMGTRHEQQVVNEEPAGICQQYNEMA